MEPFGRHDSILLLTVQLSRPPTVCSASKVASQLQRLIGQLEDVIDPTLDSVMIYRFPGTIAPSRQRLGVEVIRELDEPWIL